MFALNVIFKYFTITKSHYKTKIIRWCRKFIYLFLLELIVTFESIQLLNVIVFLWYAVTLTLIFVFMCSSEWGLVATYSYRCSYQASSGCGFLWGLLIISAMTIDISLEESRSFFSSPFRMRVFMHHLLRFHSAEYYLCGDFSAAIRNLSDSKAPRCSTEYSKPPRNMISVGIYFLKDFN